MGIKSQHEKRDGGTEKGWRPRRFVACPVCGATEAEVIVFGFFRVTGLWLFHPRPRIEGVPVKCKKCGTEFDGLTGLPLEEEFYYFRKTQRFHLVLFAIFALLLVVVIILKAIGWL